MKTLQFTPRLLPLVALLLVVPLTGCGMKEYYEAQTKLLEYQMARLDRQEAEDKKGPPPLVNHSWVDIDNNKHSLIVNQPQGYYQPPRKQAAPQLHIPAPWEPYLAAYDRTLTFGERMLPSWLSYSRSGSSKSGNQSYTFGDDATFMMSHGDYSPLDYQRDISETPLIFAAEATTTDTEETDDEEADE